MTDGAAPHAPDHLGTGASKLTVREVEPNDSLWRDFLQESNHDIYHTPEYVSLSASQLGGEGRALIAVDGDHGLLLPFVRRSLPGKRWDAASPYGYSGPISRGQAAPMHEDQLILQSITHLAQRGCVSFFLRTHPGINHFHLPTVAARSSIYRSSTTAVIDLAESTEDMWSQTASGHRNEINRARRDGYTCVEDANLERILEFAALYRKNMETIGSTAFYRFPDTYFLALRQSFPGKLSLVVAVKDGDIAAGSLFSKYGKWVQYHLAATDPAHRKSAPGKLIIDWMRQESRQSGYRWLHLGGGRGGANDSLLAFKQSFTRHQMTYRISGLVLDSSSYSALCGQGKVANSLQFPQYRSV